MLTKKVPFYYLLVVSAFFLLLMSVGVLFYKNKSVAAVEAPIETSTAHSNLCDLNAKRLNGYQFIKPLLYAEPYCESQFLASYKHEIESLIGAYKSKGDITSAAVYIRTFANPQWIAINETEKFSPGSLLKVPEMMTLYKMEEAKPGFLKKTFLYEKPFVTHRNTTFNSNHIQVGKTYSVQELIRYMIVYSDNEATMMLNQVIDRNMFNKVFSDVGLKEPDFNSNDYPMSAPDYSVFFKELFNGSYLTMEHSEACMKLLTESDFEEGMMGGLPSGCMAAHKFGEGGPENAPNFCESAMIYTGNKPFLLTIMTKGADMKKLPNVVKEITKKVYAVMGTTVS